MKKAFLPQMNFFEQEGFTKKEEVTVDTSITFSDDDNYSTNYYSNQKLTLKLSVGDADVLLHRNLCSSNTLMPEVLCLLRII